MREELLGSLSWLCRRAMCLWKRKTGLTPAFMLLLVVFPLGILVWVVVTSRPRDRGQTINTVPIHDSYLKLASEVREATLHSWKAYKEHAWGMDELRPLSQTGTLWMGTALTMIESLDTLWIMDLRGEFTAARNWISKSLNFDLDNDHVSLFEITIRVLGGLLSAYTLSKDKLFLEKAENLGPRLLSAFDPQSVLPRSEINLRRHSSKSTAWPVLQSLSEVSSIQLELNQLTVLIGNMTYALEGSKILKHLHAIGKTHGLLNTLLFTRSGQPEHSSVVSLGAHGDSFYEYLLKVWVQNKKAAEFLRQDYIAAIQSIKDLLVGYSKPSGYLFVGELQSSGRMYSKMDHLTCFLPGTLAYGTYHGMPEFHLRFAKDLTRTCYEMYNQMPTHLSPDFVIFSRAPDSLADMQTQAKGRFNALRPELFESLFYMYAVTRDPVYQKWGANIFRAFQQHARLPSGGYATIVDVTNTHSGHSDEMNSFWIAETLKYAYLLFNETAASLFPFDQWIFNTEGHPLPILTTTNPLIMTAYGKS
ncbi:unnamed protein product [Calicophoron daubneyi]|uniref:alpha-1,2-Mannosidase n=1 Tax=Calicophoron daubneyi TaxID=300641 RepID=A0AAV2SYH9_CALDB